MPARHPVSSRAVAVVLAFTAAGLTMVSGQDQGGDDEIDRFMQRVLERRTENAAVRRQYVLDEEVRLSVTGPGGVPLWGSHREYSWYVRDGIFVQSPVRVDGVAIDEETRRAHEQEWLEQERRRARRRRPDGVSRATVSTRSVRTNVQMAIERLWGGEIDDALLDDIVDDAAAWGDHHAAIVAASHRILAARGGVAAVGLDTAVAQARDGFVMLEEGRLYLDEVAAMLDGVTSAAALAVGEASDEQFGGFLELFDLAARFGVRFTPPEPSGLGDDRRAALAGARATVLAIPEAATDTGGEAPETSAAGDGWQIPGSLENLAEPRFVTDAYFLDFAFEPGNYLLAGRETLEGREVLRIEYYPHELFVGATEPGETDAAGETKTAAADRGSAASMNKTSLITLWIDPAEHQVVRYTFENLGFHFLPGRWLVRLDDLTATMTMSQPFEGVWLPRDIEIRAAMSLATGSYEMAGMRSYRDYRAADSGGRIREIGPVVR